MEWSDKFNSFNSEKGLAYIDHYKNIVAWLDGRAKLLPPVEVNLDPIAECNLSCTFCITQRYLKAHREEVGEMRRLPTEYMYHLADFLAKWGVRGLCISGGGEPTLHDGAWGLTSYAAQRGMQVAWFTNATNIKDKLAREFMKCRWVALSVDAGDRETYLKVKGADYFDRVVHNIGGLADLRGKIGSEVDLCFKFAVLPENEQSIYQACLLAKELGVQSFHVRPVDFERDDVGGRKLELNLPLIQEQFQMCHELEDDNFKVFTVTHKFDPEFHVQHNFTQCLATPLILPILSNGNVYICVDHKMEKDYLLGSAFPDPENILKFWGSNAHRDLIKSVNISHCSRCTIGEYSHQIEKVVLNDGMFLSFP